MLPNLLPDPQRQAKEQATTFLLMAVVVFFLLMTMWTAPTPPPANNADNNAAVAKDPLDQSVGAVSEPAATSADSVEELSEAEPAWWTLGSLDPQSPYRMLVTLTNRGGAIVRIELSDPRYRDVQDTNAYMGQLFVEVTDETAPCRVQVVGQGTPAARAGLKPNDEIVALGDHSIASIRELRDTLAVTKPFTKTTLKVRRGESEETLEVTLGAAPMAVIRPEITPTDYSSYRTLGGLRGYDPAKSDPLSFRTTLYSIDDSRLDLSHFFGDGDKTVGHVPPSPRLSQELRGVHTLDARWECVAATETEVTFRRRIASPPVELRKTYRLASKQDPQGISQAYHLTMTVEVRNLDTEPHRIAYQQDGPTGLPLEGAWYTRKAGPGWSSYGVRDLVVRLPGGSAETVSNNLLAFDKVANPWKDATPRYIGIDSTYFQCSLLPNTENTTDTLAQVFPIRVGMRTHQWTLLTDVSFRLVSREQTLAAGESVAHDYTLFAGPKQPAILGGYGLGTTLSYGWFWWLVVPMLTLLHTFHALGVNYGLAIIFLTIVVRLILFPMSRKQVYNTMKMQAIQPELAALTEKYKDDLPGRQKAQGELFRKHNFNPLSGCLGLFLQLPIFIALYKGLSIDVELYGEPLLWTSFSWCRDLSAPDMLFDWSGWWASMGWHGFNTGQGIFYLGPYFNILPLLTVALFLAQQWTMMPTATEEQRMQRNTMTIMMCFFSFLFFKMPSGLCVYFLVSSLWGIAERQWIPKPKLPLPTGSGGGKIHAVHEVRRERMVREPEPSLRRADVPQSGWRKWLHDLAEEAKRKNLSDKTRPHPPGDNKKGKRKTR